MKIAKFLALAGILGDAAVNVNGRTLVATNGFASMIATLDDAISELPRYLSQAVANAVMLMGDDVKLSFANDRVTVSNQSGRVRFPYAPCEIALRNGTVAQCTFSLDLDGLKGLARVSALSIPSVLTNAYVQGVSLWSIKGAVFAAASSGQVLHKTRVAECESDCSYVLPAKIAKALPKIFHDGCVACIGPEGAMFSDDQVEIRCALLNSGNNEMVRNMVASRCADPAFSLANSADLVQALDAVALTGNKVYLRSSKPGFIEVAAEMDPESMVSVSANTTGTLEVLLIASQLSNALGTLLGPIECGQTRVGKNEPIMIAESGTANGFLIGRVLPTNSGQGVAEQSTQEVAHHA